MLWRCLILLIPLCGCTPTAQPDMTLTLATTTSTRDSGLLDELLPKFHAQTGLEVKVIAVGTGQALEMGRRGDADVLLTHAPAAEEEFVAAGNGESRRVVMFNDFVLVGPTSDPAKIAGETSVSKAFAKVADAKVPFVSRGDNSGTHSKEEEIWSLAAIRPAGDAYLSVGSGMGQTLRMTSEKQGYTLTDRGTFLAQHSKLDLAVLSEGDPLLHNVYAVIPINPKLHPQTNLAAAKMFADFLLQPATQAMIQDFGGKQYGQPLFFPVELLQSANSTEPTPTP